MRLRFEDYFQRSRSDTLVALYPADSHERKRQECRFYFVESKPQNVAA
jgi:hypothetical protein